MSDSPELMRSTAACMSYNNQQPEPAAKHLLIWGACKIEQLQAQIAGATSPEGLIRSVDAWNAARRNNLLIHNSMYHAIKAALSQPNGDLIHDGNDCEIRKVTP